MLVKRFVWFEHWGMIQITVSSFDFLYHSSVNQLLNQFVADFINNSLDWYFPWIRESFLKLAITHLFKMSWWFLRPVSNHQKQYQPIPLTNHNADCKNELRAKQTVLCFSETVCYFRSTRTMPSCGIMWDMLWRTRTIMQRHCSIFSKLLVSNQVRHGTVTHGYSMITLVL